MRGPEAMCYYTLREDSKLLPARLKAERINLATTGNEHVMFESSRVHHYEKESATFVAAFFVGEPEGKRVRALREDSKVGVMSL